jgi:hypothetical protein
MQRLCVYFYAKPTPVCDEHLNFENKQELPTFVWFGNLHLPYPFVVHDFECLAWLKIAKQFSRLPTFAFIMKFSKHLTKCL